MRRGGVTRAARLLKAKEPVLVEGAKKLLFLRGPATSALSVQAAKDLVLLKKPDVRLLSRKNDVRPFEDASTIEFLAEKNECGAFLYVSHNKKKPHNLVLGRIFDSHVLDMVELGITLYEPIEDFEGSKKALGSHPCMLFVGEDWDRDVDHKLLKSILLDVFSAHDVTGVSLQGIDHVILVVAHGGTVHFRGYSLVFKRSDSKTPKVSLFPMGPFLDFSWRRVQHASADLSKDAHRIPAQLKPKSEKNVSHDAFGETVGQLHMQRQDFTKLELKKTKASKLGRKRGLEDVAGGVVSDGAAHAEDDAPEALAAKATTAKRSRREADAASGGAPA